MNIRARLTVIFFLIVIVVLSVICATIYFFSSNYRQEDFYRRLKNRAINTAMVLTEVKEVNAELLQRMERNNPASLPNQWIVIYDHAYKMLYTSDQMPAVKIDAYLFLQIKENSEIRFEERKVEVLGFQFSDDHDDYVVVAAATDVYGLDALENLRNVLLITFSISILLVSILGWLYAGRVLKPISKIVNQVSEISELNLSRRLDEGNKKDELSMLSQTFNGMLKRLQDAFASQKNFIANASHEIKTPITAMSAEIEVSLLQPRGEAYYINVLKSVLGGLKGLNELSSQLLLLAQTSTDQPEKIFSLIRIDDILWEMKAELIKAFPAYRIDIDFDLHLNPDSLVIEGDEQLVKVAILNLMDNGCKYSPLQRVLVRLHSEEKAFITLRFINEGRGIDQDQLTKIFEPFYRGKNDPNVKGSGIGLSLVSRIVSLHHGYIEVTSQPRKATEFIVKFPVRE